MPRSTTTRRISLTAAFLGLAAGGTAACDRSPDDDLSYYCTDRNNVVVDENKCDDDSSSGGGGGGGGGGYYLWRGAGARGLSVGQKVPQGGERFSATDATARRAAGLPGAGRVTNGTVKTGVVGKGGAAHGSGGS